VTRDDLPDGGADLFSQCIRILRKDIPNCKVEVLIPDFQGNWDALDLILDARPDVINHNMEVVRRLFSAFRPQGNYDLSLELIERVGRHSIDISTKSGFMVGLGEERIDIVCLLEDLIRVGCQHLTIGQYQQPTLDKCPVERYYPPNEFTELKQIAVQMGFRHVESGPLIRSSYHAAKTIGR
jgi:lipoic acid synthetase